MKHRFLVVGIASLALEGASVADVLHLKKGGRIEGVLTQETAASLTIEVSMGQVSVPRSSVARIERKESALSEYRRRLGSIARGDLMAWADLARFASESGLRSEARMLWARVLSLDPRHAEAHLAVGHVLMGGNYVEEAEAYRASGLVHFEGRWMTPAEQSSLLRAREQKSRDDRLVAEAQRAARAAEERARRAEAEAAQARASAANSSAQPFWGYGSGVVIGSGYAGGYYGGQHGGCRHRACAPPPPPAPVATPIPQAVPVRPSSIR